MTSDPGTAAVAAMQALTDAATGATAAADHYVEWVPMWRCTCGTLGSAQSQADAHRMLHHAAPAVGPCCWRCTPDYPFMLVCPECGNKRCPKSTCHENACTRSNEPGQQGSRYVV